MGGRMTAFDQEDDASSLATENSDEEPLVGDPAVHVEAMLERCLDPDERQAVEQLEDVCRGLVYFTLSREALMSVARRRRTMWREYQRIPTKMVRVRAAMPQISRAAFADSPAPPPSL